MIDVSTNSVLAALAAFWAQAPVRAVLIGFLCYWLSGIAVALMKREFTLIGCWDILRPLTFALAGGAIAQLAVIGAFGVPPELAAQIWTAILIVVAGKVLANIWVLVKGFTEPPAARAAVAPPKVLRTRQL